MLPDEPNDLPGAASGRSAAESTRNRCRAEIVSHGQDLFLVSSEGPIPGLLLNGQPVFGRTRLRDRDVVSLGDHELVLHVPPADELRPGAVPESTAHPILVANGNEQATFSARAISVADFVQQSRALRVLSHATTSLLVHHPFPVLFERILDLVFEAVPADFAAIMLLEGESREPVIKASRDRRGWTFEPRVSRSIARRAIDGRLAVLVTDVFEDVNLSHQPSIVAHPIRGVACAPLWVSTRHGDPVRVIGLLYASSRLDGTPLRESDLEILTVLANTAAAKIETAWLLEASLEKQRLQEEMRVAAEIQAGLLPREPVRVSGYDIAGRTRSCHAVGGDLYDLVFDGAQLHLALGDVAGKGVGAAMLMVELRSTVRANWLVGTLASAAGRINADLHLNIPQDRYATFFLGRLNASNGRLTYVNAGHHRPLLIGADERCETLAEGGNAFGIFADSEYREASVFVRPNDTLLIYSDGISDAWPDPELAVRELEKIVRTIGPSGASELEQAIFDAVDRRAPALHRDDRTLIVLRRTSA